MVQQNLFLCLFFSGLGGLLSVTARAVVLQYARNQKARKLARDEKERRRMQLQAERNSAPLYTTATVPKVITFAEDEASDTDKNDTKETLREEKSHRRERNITVVGFVAASLLLKPCHFFAPWFGSVSISWPTYIGSQMVFNMMIVGILMGHENFGKPAQVATMMVISAVIYIIITGPGEPQQGQDIRELLDGNWIAIVWLCFLAILFVLSTVFMLTYMLFASDRTAAKQTSARAALVLEVVIFLNTISMSPLTGTLSKASSTLTSPDDANIRIALICVTWTMYGWWSIENYMEGRYVRSPKQFLPAVLLGSVLVNGITGLIVWEDSVVIVSWPGYATAMALLLMGVYLFSNLDFFKAQIDEEQNYRQKIAHWYDLFESIQSELTQAQVEQELMPHQRTIMTHQGAALESKGVSRSSFQRGFSDPEVGIRCKSLDISQVDVLEVAEEGEYETETSLSSSISDLSVLKGKRRSSATSRTLTSLELLSSSAKLLRDSMHASLSDVETSSHLRASRRSSSGSMSLRGVEDTVADDDTIATEPSMARSESLTSPKENLRSLVGATKERERDETQNTPASLGTESVHASNWASLVSLPITEESDTISMASSLAVEDMVHKKSQSFGSTSTWVDLRALFEQSNASSKSSLLQSTSNWDSTRTIVKEAENEAEDEDKAC